jgi:RNA polymerase-binding protein DksA
MTLDSQVLAELKEKLLREKTRVEEEIARIAKPIKDAVGFDTNFNEIGTDEDENASEIEEYADNLALESTLEKQLKDVVEALEKIKAGNYGKCENCGADIPIERLRAYPAAKKCLNC